MLHCARNSLNLSKASQFGSTLAGRRPIRVCASEVRCVLGFAARCFFGAGVTFGFLGGMLSFFPPKCAKYFRSGYLGEYLRSIVRRLCCRRFAKAQVVHCRCRVNEGRCPFNLPRTGIFCAFAPVFRQDGLCPRILPRAIRCIRQGCSAMERACPPEVSFRIWGAELLTKSGVICQQTALRALVVGSKVEQRVADACSNAGAAFASVCSNECEKVPVTF